MTTRRTLLAGLLALGLPRAALADMLDQWGPNGNGTLDHQDDLRWTFFHGTEIKADEARGVYTAVFPRDLRAENGIRFSITGYMLPIETTTTSPHFVLTRRSTGCPFCPPNEPTEAIEIFATRAVPYVQLPVTVEGILRLVPSSAAGLFFKLENAKVA